MLRRSVGSTPAAQVSSAGIVEKLPDRAYELTAHRGGALGAALEGVWQWADVNAEALADGPLLGDNESETNDN